MIQTRILIVAHLVVAILLAPTGATAGPVPSHVTEHFLAHETKISPETDSSEKRGPVRLAYQFRAADYTVVTAKALLLPANKNEEGVVNETTHLLEYKIKPTKGTPKFPGMSDVRVANQCNDLLLTVAAREPPLTDGQGPHRPGRSALSPGPESAPAGPLPAGGALRRSPSRVGGGPNPIGIERSAHQRHEVAAPSPAGVARRVVSIPAARPTQEPYGRPVEDHASCCDLKDRHDQGKETHMRHAGRKQRLPQNEELAGVPQSTHQERPAHDDG